MIQLLYEKNIIIYIYGGLCGLGLLTRLIVNLVYKHLVKESDRLGETRNKMYKHIKMKFETCFKLKIGVNNVDTFVDKNVLKYRFCGLLLSTWDNFCGQILFLNLLIVPVLAVFGVVYKCGQERILYTGALGILSSAILIIVDKSINISGKKKLMKLNLLDYFENFCKVRLEQDAVHPEYAQMRRELIQAADTNKQISAAMAQGAQGDGKDELNRRREARQRKEEERKLKAVKREEEQRKAEISRMEEERRRVEEKKLAAAKRREEERIRLEEEQQALEARRAEMKKKAVEKQQALELKKQKAEEKDQILHSIEEDLKPVGDKSDMDMLMEGLEEIAAEKERKLFVKNGKDKPAVDEPKKTEPKKAEPEEVIQNTAAPKAAAKLMSEQEEQLIEDVLKEFFA